MNQKNIYKPARKFFFVNSTLNNCRDVCGKINLHTIAAQKYITPQAA